MSYSLLLLTVLHVIGHSISDAAPVDEEVPAKVVEAPGRIMTIQPLATFNHGKPFFAERDPVTGAFDLKTTPVNTDDYIYEEFDDSSENIDRKDERIVHTANHIINIPAKDSELHKFLNLPVHYSSASKYPLISSSYANTKVQGHGTSNHRPASSSTTSTIQPSYYPHRSSTTPPTISSTTSTTTTHKPTTRWTPSTTSRLPIITASTTTKTTSSTVAPPGAPPSYEYEYEYDYGESSKPPSSEPGKSDYFMSIFNYFGGGSSSTTTRPIERTSTRPTLTTKSPLRDTVNTGAPVSSTVKPTTQAPDVTRLQTRPPVTMSTTSRAPSTTSVRPVDVESESKPSAAISNNEVRKPSTQPSQGNTMIAIKSETGLKMNNTEEEDSYENISQEEEAEITDDSVLDLKPPVKTPDFVMRPPPKYGDKIHITNVEDGGWQGKPELPTELQAPKLPTKPSLPSPATHGNGHMKPYEVRPVGNPYGHQPTRQQEETKDSESVESQQAPYYVNSYGHPPLKRPEGIKGSESAETHNKPTLSVYGHQPVKRPEENDDSTELHHSSYKPNVNAYNQQSLKWPGETKDKQSAEPRPDTSDQTKPASQNDEEDKRENEPSKLDKDERFHGNADKPTRPGGAELFANAKPENLNNVAPPEKHQTPKPTQSPNPSPTISFSELEAPSYRPPPQPFGTNQGFHSSFNVETLPRPSTPTYLQKPPVYEEQTSPPNEKEVAGTAQEGPNGPTKPQYRPNPGFPVARPQPSPQYPNHPPHEAYVQHSNPQQVYLPQQSYPQQPVGFHRPAPPQVNNPPTVQHSPQTSEQDDRRPVSWPPKGKPQENQKVPPFNFFPRPEQRPSGVGTVEAVRAPPRQPSKGSMAVSSISGDTQSYSLQTSFSIGVPSGNGNEEKVTAGTVSNVPISSIQAQVPPQFHQPVSTNTIKYPPLPSWEGNPNKPYKEPIKRKPLPNILPQFRPNAKSGTSESSGPHMMGVGYVREPMDRLQPPPLPQPSQPRPIHRSDEQQHLHQTHQQHHFPPVRPVAAAYHRTETPPSPPIPPQPVHRRNGVGNKVTTLQMMQSQPPVTRKTEEPVMVVYPSNNVEASTSKGHWRQPPTDFGNDDEFPHDLEDSRTKDTPILKVKPTTKPQIKVDFPYPLVKPLPEEEAKEYQAYVPTSPSPDKKHPTLDHAMISHHLQDHNPALIPSSPSPPPKRLIPNEGEFGWSVIGSRAEDDLTTTPSDSSSTSGPMAPPQLSGGFRPIPAPNLD